MYRAKQLTFCTVCLLVFLQGRVCKYICTYECGRFEITGVAEDALIIMCCRIRILYRILVIKVIKPKMTVCACIGENRNAYGIVFGDVRMILSLDL